MQANDAYPPYWTQRGEGEPAVTFMLRMQALYRLHRLGVRPDTATDRIEEVSGHA